MPGLKLFVSNRLEILVQKLAEELQTPLSTPLKKEVILVQSKGMERWISMELARYHGICANNEFPFPNTMVDQIFRLFIPEFSGDSFFKPEILTWKIMKLLPGCISKPGFETLQAYAGDAFDSPKGFQLSERIAYAFDQYLVFRPEMILDWEKGKENHWQAHLWRMLIRDEGKQHRAALREDFFKKISPHTPEINNLPERISVFGISSLPPFHMEVLAALSKTIPITLFLTNPCREYWGDIVSDREARKLEKKLKKKTVAAENLYLEKGNSLLASWGTLGKHFFDLVYNFDSEENACFEDPRENDLLSSIQSDILNLRERGPEHKSLVAETDRSIQVHSCHSPIREIEILHDNLLALFDENPTLMPKDILVMTPDIETYTPYIQAVFDTPEDDAQLIPYTIADRSTKSESSIVTTFLSLLDLGDSRFGAAQVITILESSSVQAKFSLSETDLERIKHWVDETGIRWGIDENTRTQLGLPAFFENSWRFGLNRLLLGYALPGKDEKVFQGTLPYDYVEGSDAPVLGNFLAFSEELFSLVTRLAHNHDLNEWAKNLLHILDTFFLTDEKTEGEIFFIRSILNNLNTIQEKSGFDKEIALPIIRSFLRQKCEKESFGFGFMSGGVTFCTMLPMRSIPFKIICLLGMSNNAYPRESHHLSFDLMAQNPRPGDRSRRNDDRYLFLEAILSARQMLYISYVGQSIQDNSPLQPSVVVSELLDYIDQGFLMPEKNILEQIVTNHRLQAFSPEYFYQDGRLFSYSKDNYEAARMSLENRKDPLPFISHGLPGADEKLKNVEITALVKFFINPAKFFLNQRLGIFPEEKTPTLSEREPFELKGLEKYELEQELLKKSLSGHDLKNFLAAFKASGKIPLGTPGECFYQKSSEGVKTFTETVRKYCEDKSGTSRAVDRKISDFRIVGKLENIFETGLIHYRYTTVKSKDRIRLWICHLILNSLTTESYAKKSLFIGENGLVAFSPVKEGEKILLDLLKKYWQGLSQPLHFFPETSWTYAHWLLEKKRDEEEALSKARSEWEQSPFKQGECEDPSFRLCLGKRNPLDAEFRRLAREIFEPMLNSQVER